MDEYSWIKYAYDGEPSEPVLSPWDPKQFIIPPKFVNRIQDAAKRLNGLYSAPGYLEESNRLIDALNENQRLSRLYNLAPPSAANEPVEQPVHVQPMATPAKRVAPADSTGAETNSAITTESSSNVVAVPRIQSLSHPGLRWQSRTFSKRYNGYCKTRTPDWANGATDWNYIPYLAPSLYMNAEERTWFQKHCAMYKFKEVRVHVHQLTPLQITTNTANEQETIPAPMTYLEFCHATGESMPVYDLVQNADATAELWTNGDNQYQLNVEKELPQWKISFSSYSSAPPYVEKHPNFTIRAAGDQIGIKYQPGSKFPTSMDQPFKQLWQSYTATTGPTPATVSDMGYQIMDPANDTGTVPSSVSHMKWGDGLTNNSANNRQFTWSENSFLPQHPDGNWARYFLVRNHYFMANGVPTKAVHNFMIDYELDVDFVQPVENAEFWQRNKTSGNNNGPILMQQGPIRQHVSKGKPTAYLDGSTYKIDCFNIGPAPVLTKR